MNIEWRNNESKSLAPSIERCWCVQLQAKQAGFHAQGHLQVASSGSVVHGFTFQQFHAAVRCCPLRAAPSSLGRTSAGVRLPLLPTSLDIERASSGARPAPGRARRTLRACSFQPRAPGLASRFTRFGCQRSLTGRSTGPAPAGRAWPLQDKVLYCASLEFRVGGFRGV